MSSKYKQNGFADNGDFFCDKVSDCPFVKREQQRIEELLEYSSNLEKDIFKRCECKIDKYGKRISECFYHQEQRERIEKLESRIGDLELDMSIELKIKEAGE